MSNPHNASKKADIISEKLALFSFTCLKLDCVSLVASFIVFRSLLQRTKSAAATRPKPINIPGTIPAINSLQIDTGICSPATTEKTIKAILGGIIIPIEQELQIKPTSLSLL